MTQLVDGRRLDRRPVHAMPRTIDAIKVLIPIQATIKAVDLQIYICLHTLL